jgi:hypothetical protein
MARATTFAVKAISGFRSEVVETFGLLGCSAAHVVNWLPKFWYNVSVGLIFQDQAIQEEYSSPHSAVLRAPLKKTYCVLGGRY